MRTNNSSSLTPYVSFLIHLESTGASGRRTHRATATRTWTTHVAGACSTFEDAEAIDEVYHEIAAQGVILRVLDVVGCHGASDVAALL